MCYHECVQLDLHCDLLYIPHGGNTSQMFFKVTEQHNGDGQVVLCQIPSLVPQRPLSTETLVQSTQLPQEAVVGPDLSLLANRGQGSVDIHVLAEHQVGYDQRRGAAVAFPAVNINLT